MYPFLPELKPDNGVGGFAERGVWSHRSWQETKHLYEGLKIERKDFQVRSIPDVWARPILFETALLDPQHPLHDSFVGEWRGLLAILALRERRGIPGVQAVPVFEGRDGALPAFLEVAQRLMPAGSLATDTTWTGIHVLMIDGHPIGMTSPMTLVCTASSCKGRVSRDRVPWFNAGQFEDKPNDVLTDPTPLLSRLERRDLAAWLNWVKSKLVIHPGVASGSNAWNNLLAEFTSYIGELAPKLAVAALPIKMGGVPLHLASGIFQYLNLGLAASRDGVLSSHVRVMAEDLRRGAKPHILCLDMDMAKQWNLPAREIIAIDGVPLDAACSTVDRAHRNQIAGHVYLDVVWKEPKEIFAERLYVIRQGNALPGATHGGTQLVDAEGHAVTPLVPLKEEILGYIAPGDIAKRLRWHCEKDKITVRFDLPLSGPDLTGRDYTVTRDYTYANKEIVGLNEVPVVEVWPDFECSFRSKPWSGYYVYYSTAGLSNLFRARPYAVDTPATPVEGNGFEITPMSRFPEALVCSAPGPHSSFAGLILLAPPSTAPAEQTGKTLSVGVDFGTTGTRIFKREPGLDPTPVVFSARSRKVTESGANRAAMYKEFLPSLQEATESLLSLFHQFGNIQNDPQPVIDGHVYFVKELNEFSATRAEIAKNMKWGHARERILARLFLQQLALQTIAEAVHDGVSDIQWAVSYPASFSQTDREAFGTVWDRIVNSCAAHTGVAQKLAMRSDESTAAARFFAHQMKAPLNRGTVCIDIGGGTSDIAVWQKDNRLRCHASVRLAGRDILLFPLYVWPAFLNTYFQQGVERLTDAADKKDRHAFYAQADAILKSVGEKLLADLPARLADPAVKDFTGLIGLGLCGLFYYVGLLLKALNASGDYEPQMPNVYLGGNGAKLLHWCSTGKFNEASAINSALKQTLVQATGFNATPFDIKISTQPKAEVAYGLLIYDHFVDPGDLDPVGAIKAKSRVIAGEAFTYSNGGGGGAWSNWLTADRVHDGIRVDGELRNLSEFIAGLSEADIVNTKPGFDDAVRRDIASVVDQELINEQHRENTEIRLQPLFIEALKTYLQWKADKWAEANSAVRTRGTQAT